MSDWKLIIRERLAGLKLDPRREAEIIEELAQHLEQSYTDAMAGGLSPEAARAQAVGTLEGSEVLVREIRAAERARPLPESIARTAPGVAGMRGSWLTDVWSDLRFGLRALAKNPGFAAVAVITLALGIGANTAIFSVVRGVLLQPLPYPDSDRLALLMLQQEPYGSAPQIAYLDYVAIREQSPDFENLTAILIEQFVVLRQDAPVRVNGLQVTSSFFSTMGVQPVLGRGLLPEEELEGKGRVAVVSDRFWRESLNSRREAIGAPLTLDGSSYTVVGVLPPGFDFRMPLSSSFSIGDVDIYVPVSASNRFAQNRAVFTFEVVGRLKPGADWQQAQAGLDTIAARLESAYPETNNGRRFRMVSLHDQTVGSIRPALLVLFAAAGLVLLIACANLGSLLLARATARHKELCIRAALGASRSRILRQLITESLLLAMLGGSAGLLLAIWARDILVRLPGIQVPRLDEISVDSYVLLFAAVVTLATGLVCGLAPAFSVRGSDVQAGLGGSSRTSAGRFAARARAAMVAAQVAVACLLLAGSALLLASLIAVLQADAGFDADRVLTMRLSLTGRRYQAWKQVRATYGELAARVEALPGVDRVTLSGSLPLSGHNTSSSLWIDGQTRVPGEHQPSVRWQYVFPGYFEAMGIPLLRGRDFAPADQDRTVHQTVVSESLARANFPGEDPIGKRVYYGTKQEKPEWHEIVGVVGDVRHSDLEETPVPRAYDLYGQHNGLSLFLIVRTAADPATLVTAVRKALRELDPEAPLYSVSTMQELRERSVAPRKYLLILMGCFAGLAFVLAVVGIHGVLAYNVTRRTREIGVRVALGAKPADVLQLVVREGMAMALAGMVVGLAASLGLGRFLQSLLYGVTAADFGAYLLVAAVVLTVALLACVIPARRAMRVDPMVALRHE